MRAGHLSSRAEPIDSITTPPQTEFDYPLMTILTQAHSCEPGKTVNKAPNCTHANPYETVASSRPPPCPDKTLGAEISGFRLRRNRNFAISKKRTPAEGVAVTGRRRGSPFTRPSVGFEKIGPQGRFRLHGTSRNLEMTRNIEIAFLSFS